MLICGLQVSPAQTVIGLSLSNISEPKQAYIAERITHHAEKMGFEIIQFNADSDPDAQYRQILKFIEQRVDGIICVPRDARTVIPMIKEANHANIPFVCLNQPVAVSSASAVNVVANNFGLGQKLGQRIVEKKKSEQGKILIFRKAGLELSSISRRDGFISAVKPRFIEDEIVKIALSREQQNRLEEIEEPLQSTLSISLIAVLDGVILDDVVDVLKSQNRFYAQGQSGHIPVVVTDGSSRVNQLLVDGYIDAAALQDIDEQCRQSLRIIKQLTEGKSTQSKMILEPGRVVTEGTSAPITLWQHVYQTQSSN